MLAWILVIVILLGCCGYIIFTPNDVDPYFISHQASISSTKGAGETAVFRSLANEHGRALMGSMRPINQFKVKYMADELDTFRVSYVTKTGRTCSIDDFSVLVARVQQAISGYPPRSEITMSFDVGIEAFVAYIAVVLSGRTPKLASYSSQMSDDDEDTESSTAHTDSTESLEDSAILRQAEFKFAEGMSGIEVRKDAETSVVVPLFDSKSNDEDRPKLQVEDLPPDFVILRIGNAMSISQVDLGVSIAGQLTAAGSQHRWTSTDSVFVAPGPITAYSIAAMLTALSAKAQLIFAELGPMMTAAAVLQRAKPTILVSDDLSMRSLSKQVDDFQLIKWLQYGLRRARLSRGALTKPGMIPGFASVRLVHTATGPDPYQWLDNSEMANIRVLSGTQVIHVYNPDEGLPVCQTAVGDYRSSGKLPGVVMGPPLPGLELKKRGDKDLLVLRANHSAWQSVSPECSEHAKLSKDGCLYIPAKRKDFSDYYYYTGELK